jgi:hypothetical protein
MDRPVADRDILIAGAAAGVENGRYARRRDRRSDMDIHRQQYFNRERKSKLDISGLL